MRTFFRTLAAATILTALILGTAASTVLAASSASDSPTHERHTYDDAWCFDYGTSYDCSTVDASLAVTTRPDGREIARIHFRMIVKSFDPSGVQIGSSRTVSLDRTVFTDGGRSDAFSMTHTRAAGDFGKCVSTYLLKIVDYDLQFEKSNGPGCH